MRTPDPGKKISQAVLGTRGPSLTEMLLLYPKMDPDGEAFRSNSVGQLSAWMDTE